MDVELKEMVEELIDIETKIGWWIGELEKRELQGAKIPEEHVLENKNILNLYKKSQGVHEKLIEKLKVTVNDLKYEIQIKGNIFNKEERILNALIGELRNYAIEYYEDLGLVDKVRIEEPSIGNLFKNSNFANSYRNTITEIGMYYGTENEEIMNAELEAICSSLEADELRINSFKSNKILKNDKICILDKAAKREFYKEDSFKYLQEKLERIGKLNDNPMLSIEQRIENERDRETLIRTKYINYYMYLEDRFHGFIRENEVGKFEKIEEAIENKCLSPFLDLTDYEIEFNIKKMYDVMDEYLRSLKEEIKKSVASKQPKKEYEDYGEER